MASSHSTESQTHINNFLTANPALDSELGKIEIKEQGMTGRYTNEEWEAQIAETQRRVFADVAEREKEGGKGWKYGSAALKGDEEGVKSLAKMVDHTVLKLDAKEAAIDALCSEARTYGFKSVCVRLPWVRRCVSNLKGSGVVVACVVGFHEGTHDTYEKLREARAAVLAGAKELDIVLNHSLLTKHNRPPPATRTDSTADTITAANTAANSRPRNGVPPITTGPYSIATSLAPSTSSTTTTPSEELPDYSTIYAELANLRTLCPPPTTLKLILETSQLSPPQILAAAHLAAAARFDFIKTSTGFNGPGATLPHVRLMVAATEYLATMYKGTPGGGAGKRMEVKASGGIRGAGDARGMVGAGATRLGTSSGVWIVQEAGKGVEGEANGEGRPGLATRLYTDNSVGGY